MAKRTRTVTRPSDRTVASFRVSPRARATVRVLAAAVGRSQADILDDAIAALVATLPERERALVGELVDRHLRKRTHTI